mgnify:CR=1 FL=1
MISKVNNSIRASILGILSLLMILTFGAFNSVSAENGIPFQIVPILPDGQKEGITSYFSIDVDGNSKKDILELRLKNNSEETKDIQVKVVDAYTSPNGVVHYTDRESENSKIIDDKYKMSTHLKLQGNEMITLQGGEETIVRAKLDAQDIEGVLLGGFSFQVYEDEDKVDVDQNGSSFQINNEVNMVVGVMLEFDGGNEVNISIEEPYIDPMPSYYAIRLPVTMESPSFKKVEIEYDVHLGEQLVFGNKAEFEFAPKTKTNVSLPWEADSIKKGEIYTLSATINYNDENGNAQKITYEEVFKYNPDENAVDKVTSTLLKKPIEEGSSPWTVVGSAVGTLILILALIIVGIFAARKGNLYMVKVEGEDLPAEIVEGHPLYESLEKGSKPKEQGKFGIYKLRKNNGKKRYVYSHLIVNEGDTSYKMK